MNNWTTGLNPLFISSHLAVEGEAE